MTEPVTSSKTLIVPSTGDLVGAWGTAALNPNFQTIDAMMGGTTTISLSSATSFLLTVPATTGVFPGTLSQSVNSIIYFTGAQTGSAVVGFSLPGFYIVHNKCTGTTFVQLAPAAGGSLGAGNRIGAPPGKKCHVFFDGTDMDYVNMPDPGTAYDLHTNTTTLPPWMTCCTVSPYLLKNGTVYTSSVYPALSQLLGSTYGGNGATTFGVPDERARFRMAVDPGGATGRVTSPFAGFNGSTLGGAGGDQAIGQHVHANTLSDPGHTHGGNGAALGSPSSTPGGAFGFTTVLGAITINPAVTGISINNAVSGQGVAQNIPPAIVDILPLIKT